jgi:hypothetical protein
MKSKILLENNKNFILLSKEQIKKDNTIRVIYDYNNTKSRKQYELLFKILPKHELFIYKNEEKEKYSETTFNIYLDTINEFCYNNLKTRYTILFVNEEYVSYKYARYIRREEYQNKPLLKIKTIIDYYFCVTKYSVKILLKKWKIPLEKIIFLTNIFNINKKLIMKNNLQNININTDNSKYILFDLDIYETYNNITILDIWLAYYMNIKTKLIIYIHKEKQNDKLLDKLRTLIGIIDFQIPYIAYHGNIIITNDLTTLNCNYYAIILNISTYNLYYKVYDYILQNKIIIINDNKITREIFNNTMFLYSDINKINNNIDLLISSSIENMSEIENYLRYKKSNIKSIFNHFKYNKKKFITPYTPIPLKQFLYAFEYNDDHDTVIPYILKIERKLNNHEPNIDKYFRFIKKPDNKTNFCYATIIIIDNSYLPSVLVSGYKLKQLTDLNIVCFVQDQPYYENGKKIFSGLSNNDIKQIKKIYDCVIGIDIINKYFNKDLYAKQFINDEKFYIRNKNKIYYMTKITLFSFIYYKKIFYFDASVLINVNMDSIFMNDTFVLQVDNEKIQHTFIGNYYLIIPKKYYILKFLYLIKKYKNIFDKNKFKCRLTPYLCLIYYTIFPHYIIGEYYIQDSGLEIDRFNDSNNNYIIKPIINYPYNKPFRYSLMLDEPERDVFLLNYIHYAPWDLIVQELISKIPAFKKYFKYIKTFRYTNFSI